MSTCYVRKIVPWTAIVLVLLLFDLVVMRTSEAALTIQVEVPSRAVPGQIAQITKVKLYIDVDNTPVTSSFKFTVNGPNPPAPLPSFTVAPGSVNPSESVFPSSDLVTPIAPPPITPMNADDPRSRRYEIIIDLNSNKSLSSITPETWTVTSTKNMTAVCVQSFYQIGNDPVVVVPDNTVAKLVSPVTNPSPQNCLDARKPVDAVLVLDKSGSMSSSTLGGAPQPKIQAMRSAVKDFMDMWDAIRAGETTSYPDKIGVVQFDSTASWWKPTGSFVDGLNTYSPTISAGVSSNVNSIIPGSATALGSGVHLADSVLGLTSPDRRRLILLMSDGMQNTDKIIGLDGSGKPVTYAPTMPATKTVLPNWNASAFPMYGVTVGTSAAISSQVFQDLTTATGGFNLNSETDAGLLRPFFMQILQNFIKFSTWETVRLVSEKVTEGQSYSTKFPLASTSTRVSINVLWPSNLGALRLSVTPPGEAQPRVMTGEGSIHMNLDLPTSRAYTVKGDWLVNVDQEPVINFEVGVAGGVTPIPFDLVVMADDHGLNSDLSIEAKPYGPGDKIKLQTSVQEFGRRIKTLGANAGDKLLVHVVHPGVSIGDLLSDSSASATAPTSPDPSSPADTKLNNHLQKDPASLVRNQNTIALVDDGVAEHGDAVAGDGIYSALYPAQKPGHYNFLFGIEGLTKEVGRFSRQQLRTVLVRAIPDGGTTQIQTGVQQFNGVQTYVVTMTPRTKLGDRLGPGWGNYFWFTAPGQPAVKAKDNLDGTFTAHMPFSGAKPPVVSWHFLGGASTIIADSVTADKLPVPLDNKTVVVQDVANPRPCGCFDLFCLIKRGLP